MKRFTLMICSFLILMVCVAAAEEKEEKEKKNWNNNTELSYVKTGGNTETETFSGKNLYKHKFIDILEIAWKIGALYGESDGITNAERYDTELKLSYLFTEKFYASLLGGWERDEFAGIRNKYYTGPLLGYKFFIGPHHFLTGEAGADYTKEEFTDETEKDGMRGRLYGLYEYAFTDKNKFLQSVEYLPEFEDSDSYRINSETALISSLTDIISFKTSYNIKYNNKPIPSDLEKEDTTLTVTLIITY